MAKGSAVITHKPDMYDVISERDDHGGERVYLEFSGPLLGRLQLDGDVKLRFELTIEDAINLIGEFQKSCAWFHKYMTDEGKKRVAEYLELTKQQNTVVASCGVSQEEHVEAV